MGAIGFIGLIGLMGFIGLIGLMDFMGLIFLIPVGFFLRCQGISTSSLLGSDSSSSAERPASGAAVGSRLHAAARQSVLLSTEHRCAKRNSQARRPAPVGR